MGNTNSSACVSHDDAVERLQDAERMLAVWRSDIAAGVADRSKGFTLAVLDAVLSMMQPAQRWVDTAAAYFGKRGFVELAPHVESWLCLRGQSECPPATRDLLYGFLMMNRSAITERVIHSKLDALAQRLPELQQA